MNREKWSEIRTADEHCYNLKKGRVVACLIWFKNNSSKRKHFFLLAVVPWQDRLLFHIRVSSLG